MKNIFWQYRPIDESELSNLWKNSLFVFDTNVLLNLYRYSEETSQKFLETISKLKDRIWIPYQVGFEFNKNRLTVINDQKNVYIDFVKRVNALLTEIETNNRNPFLSEKLHDQLKSITNDIENEINAKLITYDENMNSDLIYDRISEVLTGKIGEPFEKDEIKKIFSDGAKRYADKIPPGYCDEKKPEVERYGDLIIWKQIILKAQQDKTDILFITDDKKMDWWLEFQGKTISPRPELLKEFNDETQKKCHFYKPFQFLQFADSYLGILIDREVIKEVRDYQFENSGEEMSVFVQWTIDGDITNINKLILDLKAAGYNISPDVVSNNNMHQLCIVLPDIPDLERRLTSRYLSNLQDYNLNLIRGVKEIGYSQNRTFY